MNPGAVAAVVVDMWKNIPQPYGHAIVLGGSMAGLVTAQALSKHFRRVTVVERDCLPNEPAARPGVPQGEHLHALLPGGADALEWLLPGFASGLIAAGGEPLALPTDMLWLNSAGWIRRIPELHRLVSASRDLIEWHTRRLVASTPTISILDGRSVLDLCLSDDRTAITGVTLVDGAGSSHDSRSPVETLSADLVVDATGRRSRLPDRLERLGYDRPAETRIDAHLSYASRVYRRPRGDRGWKGIFLQPKPPMTSRMGLLFPIEGDRWIVTVQGAGDDRPPTDDAGFEAFTASLRSTAIQRRDSWRRPIDVSGWLCQHVEPATALRPGPSLARPTAGRRRQRVCIQPGVRPGHVGRREDGRCARP